MNKQDSTECPQPNVLIEFLQGKLHPPQLDQCESHVKDCTLCHETLVGLSSNDTLSERVAAALQEDETGDLLDVPSAEIQNLLDRLTSDDFKKSVGSGHSSSNQGNSTADAEIIADRAAEVLRCVTPSEDSLGTLGDYTLLRLIGAGSTGVVFQAFDQTLERTVALKVLRPSLGEIARNRFLIEAKLAASIEHVNVVTIFQVGQVNRLAFMAMPWLPGQTLDSLLASGEQLEENQIVEIITHVAAGLEAAHQKQLVHRDIKPANLWICEDDQRLKILDFGLARISDDNPNLTATGMLAGTPNFMSPEQTRGLELDGRSDLFSLGCVLYRLLAGKLPFGAPTVLATLSSIQTHNPAPPVALHQDVNQDLSDLTMCLLEKLPANRPQSASQTIELLTNPRDQWAIAVPSYKSNTTADGQANTRRPASTSGAGSRRGWSTWVPTLIGLALLGGFGWWFAPQIILIATDQGEVKIETNDDNVEVQVLQDGKVVRVIDTQTQQSFSLKSGQYTFNTNATDNATDNSFKISPQTLEIHRGEKAIVKVTLDEREIADAKQASLLPNPSTKVSKAIYKGKTFDQWIDIAGLDRDTSTKTQALVACASTVETPQEETQLLDLTRSLARLHGTIFVGASEDKDLFHKAFMSVLERCNDNDVVGFIDEEIANGTVNSRMFCHGWMYVMNSGETITDAQQKRRIRIRMRAAELGETIAANLDKPYVIELTQALLPDTVNSEEVLKKLRDSSLGTEIKKFVRTASLQKRYEISKLALGLLPDNQGISNTYRKDLFDSEMDQATIEKLETLYSSVTNWAGGTSQPWPVAKANLLATMLNSLAPTTNWRGERPLITPETEATRLRAAANLLAEVVDGIDPNGSRKLLLQQYAAADVHGQPGFENPLSAPEKMPPHRVGNIILPTFHNIGQRTKDQKLKLSLIKTLQRFTKLLGPEASVANDSGFSRTASLTDDIEYVMANLKGNPKKKLPINSRLRNDSVSDSAVNRSEAQGGLQQEGPADEVDPARSSRSKERGCDRLVPFSNEHNQYQETVL